MDNQTDANIQETIRTEFADATLLCIAHRLRTVVEFDRILVLDHGMIEEFDSPYRLMQQSGGIFRGMAVESGEFDELQDIARRSFQRRKGGKV